MGGLSVGIPFKPTKTHPRVFLELEGAKFGSVDKPNDDPVC